MADTFQNSVDNEVEDDTMALESVTKKMHCKNVERLFIYKCDVKNHTI